MQGQHMRINMFGLRGCAIVLLVFIASVVHSGSTLAYSAPSSKSSPVAKAVSESIGATLDALEETGDFDAAESELTALFDHLITYASHREAEAFRLVSQHRRLVRQLREADASHRMMLLRYLRDNQRIMATLVNLIQPDVQEPAEVYSLLHRLLQKRGEELNHYATLAAAICVVHDRPLDMRVNENRAHAMDPLDIFDYFVRNESQMVFGVREVPAELLTYVVDTTSSIDEMQWALSRFRGEGNLGRLYFAVSYDYDHLRRGTEKAVTRLGFTLPNILEHGGICADQAYFAMSVGKANGMPATYVRGRGANSAHAWVGYLETASRRAWWNFNAGRYEAYQGVRGSVRDPLRREWIPDNYLSLLADYVLTSESDRHNAAALHDAAIRLRELAAGKADFPPAPHAAIPTRGNRPVRQADLESQLELIEQSLRNAAGYLPAWFTVRDLAVDGELSLAQKQQWASFVHRLCGRQYPYFHYEIVVPMIQSVEDVAEQNRLWNRAFNTFSDRHDLAAAVRMQQARMWERQGDTPSALQCYEDVINRYANAGHFVVDALREAEGILQRAGADGAIVRLYQSAWQRTTRPGDRAAPYRRQSNWYRVGMRYAEWLDRTGNARQAQQVLSQLGQ